MKRAEKWGVYAPKDGIVIASLSNKSEYGNRIYIHHAGDYKTLFAHNEKNIVKNGETVKKGQLIAIMGSTGSDNKHGHFGLIPPNKPLKKLKKNCINPVPWLTDNGCYPYNTLVSYGFQHNYGKYLHEGIDFSGLDNNLINGWEDGIDANTQIYYRR